MTVNCWLSKELLTMEANNVANPIASVMCPKCGSMNIGTRFDPVFNKLERSCCNCKFEWRDTPLDSLKSPSHSAPEGQS